jgi:hypothetical protein
MPENKNNDELAEYITLIENFLGGFAMVLNGAELSHTAKMGIAKTALELQAVVANSLMFAETRSNEQWNNVL